MGLRNFIQNTLGSIGFIRNFYLKHFKKFDNKLRIYLTLKCNLKCVYCVNDCHGDIPSNLFSQISADKWIEAINREKRDIILTGGEPTLYPELIELINGIDPAIHIKMYSNLMWSPKILERYINEISRDVELYLSFHSSSKNPQRFIDNAIALKKANKFDAVVHTVRTSETEDFITNAKEQFKEHAIRLIVDDDQGEVYDEASSQEFRKTVTCSKKLILISPNGDRFQCVSKMVRAADSLENFFEGPLKAPLVVRSCDDYGYCAPCDMLGEVKVTMPKE